MGEDLDLLRVLWVDRVCTRMLSARIAWDYLLINFVARNSCIVYELQNAGSKKVVR